jgi:hypothetical protein
LYKALLPDRERLTALDPVRLVFNVVN